MTRAALDSAAALSPELTATPFVAPDLSHPLTPAEIDAIADGSEPVAIRHARLRALIGATMFHEASDVQHALERARAADEALARGELWGPLHGLPFTAKDNLDTAGLVTAVGLEERRDFIPQEDAVVVARLKAAGAILLAKTNVPPMGGGGSCDNPVYGRTNNPYDLSCTPGGSSGGEAAAIAAGLSPLGLGSDSGGSLRLPAH